MKIYLSANYTRRFELQNYVQVLTALGHTITSRWLTDSRNIFGINRECDLSAYAAADLEDLRASDTVITFSNNHETRGGMHVTFGAAIALGKRCILIGTDNHAFHLLPQVERCEDIFEALAILAKEATSK